MTEKMSLRRKPLSGRACMIATIIILIGFSLYAYHWLTKPSLSTSIVGGRRSASRSTGGLVDNYRKALAEAQGGVRVDHRGNRDGGQSRDVQSLQRELDKERERLKEKMKNTKLESSREKTVDWKTDGQDENEKSEVVENVPKLQIVEPRGPEDVKSEEEKFQQQPDVIQEEDYDETEEIEGEKKDEKKAKGKASKEKTKDETGDKEEESERPEYYFDPQAKYAQYFDQMKRIVHLDLKGAAPQVQYFHKLFPLLHVMGATGLLIEYEDMFPFSGELQTIPAENAYSRGDVQRIVALAEQNRLEIIPLVQTFGHLEYVLKQERFAALREVEDMPLVISPAVNGTYTFLHAMMDQVWPNFF